MRKTQYLLLFFFALVFTACEKDDTTAVTPNDSIAFDGNNATIKAGDLSNLRFKDLPGEIHLQESVPQGELRVQSNIALNDWVLVKRENGELRIEGNNGLPTTINLHFYLHPATLRKIVVEGKNKVLITGSAVFGNLELVTEGESELVFNGLKARNLVSRREGKSRMTLSSELLGPGRDSLFFRGNAVQVLDTKHLLYIDNNQQYLLVAPQIKVRNDSVFALTYNPTDPLRVYFASQLHTLSNQGESFLDALQLPTLSVVTKNEGKSLAKVWATNRLEVKGEGESVMHYRGNPVVVQNMSGGSG